MYFRRPQTPSAAPAPRPDVETSAAAARRVEAWLRQQQGRRRLDGRDGRLDAVTEAGGACFRYAYDARGDLATVVEADGRRRRYRYDARRRLTHAADACGEARYHYDARDRLCRVEDRGLVRRYEHDARGRVTAVRHGDDVRAGFRYDAAGRVVEARTPDVTTRWAYDADGRVAALSRTVDGVTLGAAFAYDDEGRLARMTLPGGDVPVRYTWDGRGRPAAVAVDDAPLARFTYRDASRTVCVRLGNGVEVEAAADPVDGRPVRRVVRRGRRTLYARAWTYGPAGEVVGDGCRRYAYDALGRLVAAEDPAAGTFHRYAYDALDNRTTLETGHGAWRYAYDDGDRLVTVRDRAGGCTRYAYDGRGRCAGRTGPDGTWRYAYDAAGRLRRVRRGGRTVARFRYDHKGLLAAADFEGHGERYLYGPSDELLAVADAAGRPLRLTVRTPLGVVAEVRGPLGAADVRYPHDDGRGTVRLATDASGAVAARHAYAPFGLPETPGAHGAVFGGHAWVPEVRLYYCGARWYDPAAGRFLTPDTYTGAPDDERLVNPVGPASAQAAGRAQILGAWLKQPRVRHAYAFCGNDPVGSVDPSGHWSFGGVLLSVLGALWTLPNTLFGLLIEVTCLIGEVIRWLVWLVTGGNVSWETPGFDAAASGRLNAFALVFEGGWIGSIPSLLGITFGNVFFVYKQWRTSPHITGFPDPIHPPAYDGKVSIPREQALYEHELRHTNQYAWWGPFFHLGLPVFGAYLWDVILSGGYADAWFERDAREHAEP